MTVSERSLRRAAFRRMSRQQKLGYILAYYKAPILMGFFLILLLCSVIHRQAAKKEPALYAALVNVSIGESLEESLTTRFIEWCGADARKTEVYLYRDLYLSDNASLMNHEYAYASRLKLLGAINAKQLDLVLMNQESYDLLSRSGYLMELTEFLHPDIPLYDGLAPYLVENEVLLEDNAIEYNLNEAAEYRAVTETAVNAVEISGLPLLRSAEFPDAVYLGVIANTERSAWICRYFAYLFEL